MMRLAFSILTATPTSLLLLLLSNVSPIQAQASAPILHKVAISYTFPAPLSHNPTFQPLAQLTFSTDPLQAALNTIDAYNPPSLSDTSTAPDETEGRESDYIGITPHTANGGRYTSTATKLSLLHSGGENPDKPPGRFRIVVDTGRDGLGADVISVSYEPGTWTGVEGDFDVLVLAKAAAVVLDLPVSKGKKVRKTAGQIGESGQDDDGDEEAVEPKSLFQQYWWVLLGVAVLALSSGGDK